MGKRKESMSGLVALFAHPDDKVYRCGDTLMLLARRGVQGHLITASRCHRSQQDESPILRAPEARPRLFLGTEHLQRAASRAPNDVFALL